MRFLITDLATSLSLLSRLPVRVNHVVAGRRSAEAAWGWPVVGVLIAALAALPGLLLTMLAVPAPIAAGASLLTMVMLTGAMHEDGLADSADGLWGGWEPVRRLEIMKDSRVGVYGVLALVLTLGLRWSALAALLSSGTLAFLVGISAAAALSRAAMAGVMHALPPAREDGLAAGVGAVPSSAALIAALLGLAFSLGAGIAAGITAALVTAAVSFLVALVARAKIGGQTGDILGATQQVAEVSALLTLTASLT
ncbi:MAG: adenosylcobinamide-GDP ribazoletransferase [Pseudomonadota bacterium]